jgi:hypothetical protein
MRAIGKISLEIGMSLCLAVSVLLISCNKEEPTIVAVTVIDVAGKTVPDALVNIAGNGTAPGAVNQPSNQRFNDTKTTNAAGKVSFDYSDLFKAGQSGFVVLDVEASRRAEKGQSVVDVKEYKVTEATVRIEP